LVLDNLSNSSTAFGIGLGGSLRKGENPPKVKGFVNLFHLGNIYLALNFLTAFPPGPFDRNGPSKAKKPGQNPAFFHGLGGSDIVQAGRGPQQIEGSPQTPTVTPFGGTNRMKNGHHIPVIGLVIGNKKNILRW